MGCEAQLAQKCLFAPTFQRATLTSKVGQNSQIFGVIRAHTRSVCATLQVTVCSGYDLCRHG